MTKAEETIYLWERLPQSLDITPQGILQITAYRGLTIEDMVESFDVKFPGILRELSSRYLDQVLLPISKSIISRGEVLAYVRSLGAIDKQVVRDLSVNYNISKVNPDSPLWVKSAMIGLIEFGLGNYSESLRASGFSSCEFLEPRFPEIIRGDSCRCSELLLKVELDKASILTQMLTEQRAKN